MNTRSLTGLVLTSCAIVLTGWGTMNLAGLTMQDSPGVSGPQGLEAPAAGNVSAAPPPANPAAPAKPAEPSGSGRALNRLLFSPEFLSPQPRQTEAASPSALTPTEPAGQAPVVAPGQDRPPDQTAGRTEKRGNNGGPTASKPARDTFRGPFTAAHIDRIKRRLNLTAEQEELWKPVEAALRRIAARQKGDGDGAPLSAVESQNLYWAAGPLIMSLRPDQREQARNLARSMGLESVASLL